MSASSHPYRQAPRSVQAPLLDRLLDAEPERAQDRREEAAGSVQKLRAAVHRDLEALLNSRCPWASVPPEHAALRRSSWGFGIPDFASGAFNDRVQREALREAIEDAVTRHEPRLTQVKVSLVDEQMTMRATLRLRIRAMLLVSPSPEPLGFDTAVDLARSAVTLSISAGA